MSTILERIGGREVVDEAIEIFYVKVMADPSIAFFFEKINMKKLIIKQKAFFVYAFGGGTPYTGDDLREMHTGLSIKDKHFVSIRKHFIDTLVELDIAEDVLEDVGKIIDSFYDDVVNL